MDKGICSSLAFELVAPRDAYVPLTMGHQAHALFLNLITRFDPARAARLHNEPAYHPYTLSPLMGGKQRDGQVMVRRGQPCYLRVTLFDGGDLWHALQRYFLEAGPIFVQLGRAAFQLTRIHATPQTGPAGWVDATDLHTLISLPAHPVLRMSFCSPTAFSLSNHQFHLFPEPVFVWESLLRAWNGSVPAPLRMEKSSLRGGIEQSLSVISCTLETAFLCFPRHVQKGFHGQCTYQLVTDHPLATQLTTLAAFAYYAGVGYKTTMGMGQTQVIFADESVPVTFS